MAKDISEGATAQYKVLIRPTDVGLLVMSRLQRPALDKSAELRRLIELGYAAEQAGFILDGTILRNGGRVWDVQPVANEAGPGQFKPAKAVKEGAALGSTSPSSGADAAVESPGKPETSVKDEATSGNDAQSGGTTGLRANLRRLSNP
jgi:hypothetical protein